MKRPYRVDYAGRTYAKWTILRRDTTRCGYWECQCKCGTLRAVRVKNLITGVSISCGCSKKDKRKDLGYSGLSQLIRQYKNNARLRNLEFTLTRIEFQTLTSSNCYYCNISPQQISNISGNASSEWRKLAAYKYNGLDRVDNTIGYIFKNCVACCRSCNYAKHTRTQAEFLAWIVQVYEHSIK